MIAAAALKVSEARLTNVVLQQRDFLKDGFGCPDASVGYALLFNILHVENPVTLLREPSRTLRPGGFVGIIHWKHDESTPRGPSITIRPTAAQCRHWAENAGLEFVRDESLCCYSWHYGQSHFGSEV